MVLDLFAQGVPFSGAHIVVEPIVAWGVLRVIGEGDLGLAIMAVEMHCKLHRIRCGRCGEDKRLLYYFVIL